jgi:hypothetical protein
MYGGLQIIACPGDFDSLDDISLEDIVPLDPFLSPNGIEIAQTLPLLDGAEFIHSIHNWTLGFSDRKPHYALGYDGEHALAMKRYRGLWLINQAILC